MVERFDSGSCSSCWCSASTAGYQSASAVSVADASEVAVLRVPHDYK